MEMNDQSEADNADQYIDRIMEMLRTGDASNIALELTDKTLRSFLKALDAEQESAKNAEPMLVAMISVMATMVENAALRVCDRDDVNQQINFYQFIVEELAERLTESASHRLHPATH